MPILQCTKCEKTFRKWLVKGSFRRVGVSGVGIGFGFIIPIYPFVLKIHTTCPNCGENVWMEVLKPGLPELAVMICLLGLVGVILLLLWTGSPVLQLLPTA